MKVLHKHSYLKHIRNCCASILKGDRPMDNQLQLLEQIEWLAQELRDTYSNKG